MPQAAKHGSWLNQTEIEVSLLIVVDFAGFTLGRISFTHEKKNLDLGFLQVSHQREEHAADFAHSQRSISHRPVATVPIPLPHQTEGANGRSHLMGTSEERDSQSLQRISLSPLPWLQVESRVPGACASAFALPV